MFNSIAFTVIDAVQTGKKEFVNLFVKHDQLADVMYQYIDTQTKYTKDFVGTAINLSSDLFTTVTKPNFTKEVAQSYGLDKLSPIAKAASKKAK